MKIKYLISIAVTLSLCFSMAGQDTSRQQKEKVKLEKEIELLNKKLGENEKKEQTNN